MNNRERIESKVGVIFQITDKYLSGQMRLEEAKAQINDEMVNIRPAYFEAIKLELRKRLKKAGSKVEIEKLFELFNNYLSFPYKKLEVGHPLRNYYDENSRVRQYLVRIDEMEGEEATLDKWKEVYELLNKYIVHIKRQKKNFHPLMINSGISLLVEKVQELGDIITKEINKNQAMLENGDIFSFLFNQRSLTLNFMKYLKMEEKVLFPKALKNLTNEDFLKLRRIDDIEGYAYIKKPVDFVPRENRRNFYNKKDSSYKIDNIKGEGKYSTVYDLLLPSILSTNKISIIYFNISGEVIYTMGEQVEEIDLQISEETKHILLTESEKQRKYIYNKGNQIFLITYSLINDRQGRYQGILKTKEDISRIKGLNRECLEFYQTERINMADNNIKKEDRNIDSSQNISELFDMYPKFKNDFFRLNEDLEGLKGAKGMAILKEATVGMVAKSLCIDTDDFIDKIKELLETY